MEDTRDINGIQAGIIRQLFHRDGLRFSEINVDNVPSDQFSYHLRQLLKYGLIDKSVDNTYSLSVFGKTRAIMLRPNKAGFIEQGFLAVRVILTKIEDHQRYYLMQQRKLVPYKGTYATPGDKILFGEDVAQAAQRAMSEQTGLTCDVSFKGIRHLKDEYLGKIVQDKYFFVFAASNPRGELLASGRTGTNHWLTRAEIEESGLSIQSGLEILDMVDQTSLDFDEATLKIKTY